MNNKMPLVSIIIPTYNRLNYFQQALKSALAQTYRNIEIVVVDDSTNYETYNLIQHYLIKYPYIRYYRNKTNIGGALNFIQGFEYSNGEYVNFLMDDDIFHPEKIETMIAYFLNDTTNEISLVTSYRPFIDENGNNIPDNIYNQKRFNEITLVNGIKAASSIISEFNWIGEPTTPLFRKKDLLEPFGVFSGRLYRSGVDIAAWLHLLSKGNLVYIPLPLSNLRIHSNNISKDTNMLLYAVQDLIHLLFHCRQHKYLLEPSEYQKGLKNTSHFHSVLSTQLSLTTNQKMKLNYYSLLLLKLSKEFKQDFSSLHT
ncbi:glycosyltransferase family 2 protein [Bacillus sp. FSL K6-0268]|uniref:glycosyltransferase family 2 protein n=1 Tax=Bacillus sp. FSL K6-0268 TaxID=2921449 RepID=UPI0030F5B9DB